MSELVESTVVRCELLLGMPGGGGRLFRGSCTGRYTYFSSITASTVR